MKEKNRFVKFLPLVVGLVVFMVLGNVVSAINIDTVEVYDAGSLHVRDAPAEYQMSGWARIVSIPFYSYVYPYRKYDYLGDLIKRKFEEQIRCPECGHPIPVSPSIGNVTQRIFPSTVPPGGTLKITLIPSPTCRFDYPDYRVTERIPAGFTFISTTAYNATVNGNVVSLRQTGGSSITYTLKAPSITGTYAIEGTFMDDRWDVGSVRGTTSIRVDYDTKGNGRIDISKAFLAVMDNFIGLIGKQESFCKVSDWKRMIFLQLN